VAGGGGGPPPPRHRRLTASGARAESGEPEDDPRRACRARPARPDRPAHRPPRPRPPCLPRLAHAMSSETADICPSRTLGAAGGEGGGHGGYGGHDGCGGRRVDFGLGATGATDMAVRTGGILAHRVFRRAAAPCPVAELRCLVPACARASPSPMLTPHRRTAWLATQVCAK